MHMEGWVIRTSLLMCNKIFQQSTYFFIGYRVLHNKMASWNPYPCPMCKAEPSHMPTEEIESFDFDKYPVTLPDRTEITFEQATTKYLEFYFPNYETDSFKVPAAFSYDQDESLDFVTDDEVTEVVPQKVMEKQQRGKAKIRKWKGPQTPQKVGSSSYEAISITLLTCELRLRWVQVNDLPNKSLNRFY